MLNDAVPESDLDLRVPTCGIRIAFSRGSEVESLNDALTIGLSACLFPHEAPQTLRIRVRPDMHAFRRSGPCKKAEPIHQKHRKYYSAARCTYEDIGRSKAGLYGPKSGYK